MSRGFRRTPNPWGSRARLKVGLLGGSFNPAHAGHRHISQEALRALGLDEVWWLVSPQNPLKPIAGMAPLAERLAEARLQARHRRILVSALEQQWGTRYTADTIARLRRRFPNMRFVWLMGADNLRQIPKWDRWLSIFGRVAVAVLDRSPYSYESLAGRAAVRFIHARIPPARSHLLPALDPPAWIFLHSRRHPASATAIRHARSGPADGNGQEPFSLLSRNPQEP